MAKRRMTAEDLLAIKFIGDPQISPDGNRIAYVEVRIEKNKDEKAPKADEYVYRSNIWLAAADGGEPRQFTFGTGKDQHPRWSPDGKRLAFVSDRAEKNQIWLIDLAGGEARQLTKLKVGASNPVWSPDGTKIAFIARTDAEDEAELLAGAATPKAEKPKKSDVRVIDSLRYKADGTGFLDGKHAHVWVIDVASGEAKQLTFGDRDDASPTWTADGKAIIFSSYRGPEPDFALKNDLWIVPVEGGEPKLLVECPGPAGEAAVSPDGSTVAYLGHDQHAAGATNTGLWLAPVSGGRGRLISGEFDRSLGGGIMGDCRPVTGTGGARPTWAPDGKSIYYLAADHGANSLYRFFVDGGQPEPVIGGPGRTIDAFSMSADGRRVAFVAETPDRPTELFIRDERGTERRLTKANDALLAEVETVTPTRIAFKGADGWDIEGWLMKPAGYEEGKKYPLVLEVHGGPHGDYGYGFFHEFQYLAAQGWGVLYINPRGSSSYGEAFTYGCIGKWGDEVMEDLMRGLDHAIAEHAWIDRDRLAVTGGSYGGYMTNWIVTHTDRFKAAATQRCLSNCYSFFGTSDIGWFFTERELQGNPWDNEERLMALSPIRYVKNVRTPLLILHSERDYRCPIEQAEQMFAALKCLRRETEFVRFPDESHDLSRTGKPAHRLERLQRIVGWFAKHI